MTGLTAEFNVRVVLLLAIDPGPTESAWVLWDGKEILDKGKEANEWLTADLFRDARADAIAIECIASYGMPVGREVFETCIWIGRYIERALESERPAPTRLVYRAEVKMHLCHSMKAKDGNIRAELINRFGPGREKAIGTKRAPGPLYGVSGDVWSALAVAITAMETEPK